MSTPLVINNIDNYPHILGGALAVNARGVSERASGWLAGGHIGYHWPMRTLNHIDASVTVSPAIELEGYYIGDIAVEGYEINNNTARLIEHDFLVTIPMQTGVFLTNFILEFNSSHFQKIHPYLGVGAGIAVISVSGATSIQTSPPEPFNHYNSDTNDTNASFAVQPKVGISFSLNNTTNLFAEYRFLYLSSSDYTFGSTVYPGPHVPTSNWHVRVHSKYYNFGTVGLQYDL